MPSDLMTFTVTLCTDATPERVRERLEAAAVTELADLGVSDLNVHFQDGPAANGAGLPELPDGVDLVFGVVPDTFDFGGDPVTVTNVYITTRDHLPYLCDDYPDTVRDYIHGVFTAVGFGGGGEAMEGVWEITSPDTGLVRERLEEVPGFSHDAEFEAFMVSCQ